MDKCECEKLGSMVDVCDLHKQIAELYQKNKIMREALCRIIINTEDECDRTHAQKALDECGKAI